MAAVGLDMSGLRLCALVLAMDVAGVVIGVGRWIGCHHQADMTKTRRFVVLVEALLVGLMALAVSRPGWAAAVLVAPVLVVAVASYDRLVDTTAATRCAGYQPDPVRSPPQPTVPDPGDRETGEPPRLAPTTTGPPPTTVPPSGPEG